MAAPIEFDLLISPSLLHSDHLQIRVDGAVQTDRIQPWPGTLRSRRGFGYGNPATTPFGVWCLPGVDVPFGAGKFGQGAKRLTHRTRASFVAGDYAIDTRSIDAAGNAGGYSASATVRHRPVPPAPLSLAIAGSVLSWTWSDP